MARNARNDGKARVILESPWRGVDAAPRRGNRLAKDDQMRVWTYAHGALAGRLEVRGRRHRYCSHKEISICRCRRRLIVQDLNRDDTVE